MTESEIFEAAKPYAWFAGEGWTFNSLADLQRFAAIIERNWLERAAQVCEAEVIRPPGYGGQWEGYGESKGYKTGKECATAIRAMIGEQHE